MAAVDWLPRCQGQQFLACLGFSFDLFIPPFAMSAVVPLYGLPDCLIWPPARAALWSHRRAGRDAAVGVGRASWRRRRIGTCRIAATWRCARDGRDAGQAGPRCGKRLRRFRHHGSGQHGIRVLRQEPSAAPPSTRELSTSHCTARRLARVSRNAYHTGSSGRRHQRAYDGDVSQRAGACRARG
jgi:hypothetical protein